jgi:cytochrome c-type biogenesis protein CcmE
VIAFVPRPPYRLLAAAAGLAALAALAVWSSPTRVSVHGYVMALDPPDPAALDHRLLVLTDGDLIEVEYRGVLPDTIREEAEVVVRGDAITPSLVDADELIGKCPSRYHLSVTYR